MAYSPQGKIEGVRDEQGHSTRYQYDLNGNLVEVVNAKGHSTKYRYDAMNRVTEVHQYNKDESGIEKELVTAYRYNKKGLVVQETDAKNQVTHYSYDPAGNLVEKEDRDGYTTQYTYDAVNNVTKTVYNDNKEVKYEYDSLNRVIGMMDWLGETSYELDGLGRVIKYRDCNGGIASYEWGLMNERKAIRYPDGQMVEYSYDSNGRMAQVKDDKAITKYVYTPGGEMERELLSNGQGTSYGYDGLGRLKELTHYGKNGEALDSREIGYDEAGRKTSVHIKKSQWVEEGGRDHRERGIYSYAYDELGQLVKVTGPDHDTEHYSYDQLGNRIKKSITGSRRGQTHYVYDELNRLVEVRGPGEELGGYTIEEKAELTYDGRGNMIRIQSDGKNIGEYIYDGTNRLVRSATHEGVVASYAYDGAGRRVRKEIDGRNYDYLIDVTTPYNEPLAVTSEGIREKYIYGNKRLGTKGKEGMAAYYFHDEMGSLIRTTDEKGASTGQAELDAFGRVVAFGNVKDGIQSLMSFTGYENDQGTGLMYVQARYYMPELGRFVAEDQNKGNVIQPRSLNYYVHCINNPLKYVDRDGRAYVMLDYVIQSFNKIDVKIGYQYVTIYSIGNRENMLPVDLNKIYSEIAADKKEMVNGKRLVDADALIEKLGVTKQEEINAIKNYYYGVSYNSYEDAALAQILGSDSKDASYLIYNTKTEKYETTMAMGDVFDIGSISEKVKSSIETNGNRIIGYVYNGCINEVENADKAMVYYMENNKLMRKNAAGTVAEVADLSGVLPETPTSASDDLIRFLTNYEDYHEMPYRGADSQNRTVGYGHVIISEDGTKYDNGISREDAAALLASDLERVVYQYLNPYLSDNGISLNQQQYDALVSFTFNAGQKWITEYDDLRNILESGNITYEAMHGEFTDWIKVNGNPELGLYRRRMDELNIFFNGDYSRNYPDWP